MGFACLKWWSLFFLIFEDWSAIHRRRCRRYILDWDALTRRSRVVITHLRQCSREKGKNIEFSDFSRQQQQQQNSKRSNKNKKFSFFLNSTVLYIYSLFLIISLSSTLASHSLKLFAMLNIHHSLFVFLCCSRWGLGWQKIYDGNEK